MTARKTISRQEQTIQEAFDRLGQRAEVAFRKANYDHRAFPRIATDVLASVREKTFPDPFEILRWGATAAALPNQRDPDSRFGDVALTLFSGSRFHLDAYYWLDGTTSIHQHSFSGAFMVLSGSSFHSRYQFVEAERVNAYLRLGKLALADVELLERTAVRPIVAGQEFIHSLFHLDRPSVSLCLRTNGEPDSAPQWDYQPPGVARDPFYSDLALQKLDQVARLMLDAGDARAQRLLFEVIATSDLHTCMLVLERAHLNRMRHQVAGFSLAPVAKDPMDTLVAAARRRHGDRVALVLAAMDERERQSNLIRRRAPVANPEHRFFLALLLNIPDRKKLVHLVKKRFPDREPIGTIVGWVKELAGTKLLGSAEPNVLGIADCDEEYVAVLAGLLSGHSEARIVRDLKSAFPGAKLQELREDVRTLCPTISNSPLFKAQLS
jgi:hypothetical protein